MKRLRLTPTGEFVVALGVILAVIFILGFMPALIGSR